MVSHFEECDEAEHRGEEQPHPADRLAEGIQGFKENVREIFKNFIHSRFGGVSEYFIDIYVM